MKWNIIFPRPPFPHIEDINMNNLITHNPYRILGVYANSPKKDVLSNLNKMKAFLKVGKDVSFPLDLPKYIPPVERDEAIVSAAQSSIELPIDQLKHSLFWFMKETPLDDIAFNHLFSGNIQQAKDIWQKKECVSSLLNLIACAAIEEDYTALALSADSLFQNHASEFCASINETIKLSSEEITDLLVNILNEAGDLDMSALANVPGTSSVWQKAFAASTVKPLIDEVNAAINAAKNVKGSSANYSAGVKLMNSTKGILTQLRGLLRTSDMQYQMIADKLAQTILQCGINYYNDSEELEAAHKAMPLQEYALSIAVGQIAKERCLENYDILKKTISNLPPKEILSEVAEITKELNAYCKLPDKISHAITLLKKTKAYFDRIKLRVGAHNQYYLKLSTQVVDNALHNVIEEVNAAQKYDPAEERRQKLENKKRAEKERENNRARAAAIRRRAEAEGRELTESEKSELRLLELHSFWVEAPEPFDISSITSFGYYSHAEKDRMLKLERIEKALKEAWEATKLMDCFDMEAAFRSGRYTQNRNILKGLCKQLHIETRTDKEIERDNRLAEEARQRAKETKKKSNYLWFTTGVLYLLIAGIIAVTSGHEFWEGLLFVLWPLPPAFILSGWLITLVAEQIWKLTGIKEPFKCWLG